MDIVGLIKYLAQAVSPGEFLVVICVVLAIIVWGLKYGLLFATKGRKFLGFFAQDKDEMDVINQRLKDLTTEQVSERLAAEQKERVEHVATALKEQLAISRELLSQIAILKQQHDDIYSQFADKVERLNDQMKEIMGAIQVQNAAIKVDVSKNQELIIRALTQLEKIDEFAKSTAPEVRSSFKDITHDLKSVERDLALVAQLIQLGINSPGIKLK